jgi:DNA topoisomerase VI subunit B
MTATLERTAFTTSRLLEFFSEKELSMQIGHGRELWPAAILKELIDNALDAAETAGVAPQVKVVISDDFLQVDDNGPGIPEIVLRRSLDYVVRISDKAHYVSPTRGQLGNALKCVYAVPFVLDGEKGRVEVESNGVHHTINVTLDRIGQRPVVEHRQEPCAVKNGTVVRVHWPEQASSKNEDEDCDFYRDPFQARRLLIGYSDFNPHASLILLNLEQGSESVVYDPTSPSWSKWRPHDPTSPHWYDEERLRSLIAAYIAQEQAGGKVLSVRDFLAEFSGLSSTIKRKEVLEYSGLAGAFLHDLVSGNDVDSGAVKRLLAAMQQESRPIKPQALGVLGRDHLARCLHEHGADPESVHHKAVLDTTEDGLPFVLEVAFGVAEEDTGSGREIVTGLNWAPTLQPPLLGLAYLLGEARVDEDDPVTVLFHLACPRLNFTDRGKTHLNLPDEILDALKKCVGSVTRRWTDAKRHADRQGRLAERELEEQRKANRPKVMKIKEAAYKVMEQAYLKASGNGSYPANARQIMYAARPLVLELTGGKCWKQASYFTQTLLPNYLNTHPKKTAGWDVVFDARGHITEPHTGHRVELGTVQVRAYRNGWHGEVDETVSAPMLDTDISTKGPANRFLFALFVEKEGFDALLERADVANRFDLALMSTKGMSVTAARKLIDDLSQQGVTVLVLHDFDKSGFSIVHTLRTSRRRYKFKTRPNVIDLGLRLEDVQARGLQSEPVQYHAVKKAPQQRLRECGATQEECDFLAEEQPYGRGWTGQRVELNAMDAPTFISLGCAG